MKNSKVAVNFGNAKFKYPPPLEGYSGVHGAPGHEVMSNTGGSSGKIEKGTFGAVTSCGCVLMLLLGWP